MTEKTCIMNLYEYPDLSDGWMCSHCESTFKATKKFEKSTHCPECTSHIREWEQYDEN